MKYYAVWHSLLKVLSGSQFHPDIAKVQNGDCIQEHPRT